MAKKKSGKKPSGKNNNNSNSKNNSKNNSNNNSKNKKANKDSSIEINKPISNDTTKNKDAVNKPELEKFRKISIDDIEGNKATEKAEAKKSSYADNKLEQIGMTKKEKKAIRKAMYNENTNGMTRKEKLSYFFEYYKWRVIIPIVLVAFVCYIGITIYENKKPVALGYALLNVADADTVNTYFEDDYVEYFNITGRYQFKQSIGRDIDYDYYLENSQFIQTSNSTDYNLLSSECELGTYDVIISNAAGIKYCSATNIIKPLKGYFDSENYAALEDYMVDFIDQNGTERPFAIDISDTEFAKNLNLGYSDVYVAFPGTTEQNITNSLKFLVYSLGIDLTFQSENE